MGQVYLGLYRRGADDLPERLAAERLHAQVRIAELDALGAHDIIALGGGWQRYPPLALANEDRFAGAADDGLHPRAATLLELGASAYRRGAYIGPDAVSPAYLRIDVAALPPARTT